MVADVDVGFVLDSELLDSVESEVVDAGRLDHLKEDVADDELLEVGVVVNLGEHVGQKLLGMEGLPFVYEAAVPGNDVGEVVKKLRILDESRHRIVEILALERRYVSVIVFNHGRPPRPLYQMKG